MKQLLTLTACLLSASVFAQSNGDFSSKKSGSWNDTATWQVFNSTSLNWDNATTVPTSSNSVYIQNGDSLFMTADGACKDLHLNSDLDANDSARIATGAFTLSINGKIRTYTGAKNAASIGGTNITGTNNSKRFYNTSGGGKLKIVGTSRYAVLSGEGGVPANANGWNLEFAMNPGDTARLGANIRAGNIVISSGLVALDFNTSIRADSGLSNTGKLHVLKGATLILGGGGSGSGLFRQSGQTFESFILDSGAFLVVASTATPLSCNLLAQSVMLNGTVTTNSGRLLTNSATVGAAPVNVFNHLRLRAATTLAENITVNGILSLNSDNQLILNSKTLTYGSNALVEYDGTSAQVTSDSELPAVGGPSGIILNNAAGLSLHGSRTINKLMRMVKGNLTLGGNILSYGVSATLEYAGNVSQVSANSEFPAVGGPANLKINKLSEVYLHASRTLAGDLVFTSGLLMTSSGSVLTLSPNSNITGAGPTSYVIGPLEMTIASATMTSKEFPIGKIGYYRPITLQVLHDAATNTTYKAELFNAQPPNLTLPSLIDSVTFLRYWNITKGSGANITSAGVTLSYGAGDFVTNHTTTRVMRSSGALWENLGGMGTANLTGTVTSDSNFTSMGDFALGYGTPDSIAPYTITLPRNPVIATSSSQVAVSAIATDNRSVSSVTLYYAVNSGPFTPVNMTMSSGITTAGIWTANVPAQANGSIIHYYVKAVDHFTNLAYYPDTLATNSSYMVVNGGVNTISQLQFTNSANTHSIWTGDSLSGISVSGIVTATAKSNDLGLVTIQDGTNPNSAVFVQATPGSGIELWNRGDSVVINSCVVLENGGVTTLVNAGSANHTVAGTGKPLPAFITNISLDSIRLGIPAYTEPYEGMLMQFDSVYVVSLDPDAPFNTGEFTFHKDSLAAAGLRANDQSNEIPFNFNQDSLKLKQLLPYIKGVLSYTINNWKLLPRNLADIDYKAVPGTSARGIFDDTEFVLYPNPASKKVKLEVTNLSASDLVYDVAILDILGRTLNKTSIGALSGSMDQTIDISTLSPGVYFCNISKGNASKSIKLVVAR